MPATFKKMKSFIGNFQDFCLYFMQILIVFNISRKLILKSTSPLLKNTFKFSLLRKRLSTLKYELDLGECRGESRTAAISKMELFVIIVNGWKPLTIIKKCSILDIIAVINPPRNRLSFTALLYVLTQCLRLCCF